MREILFRGKRHKDYCTKQDWTYGVPFIDHEGDCIFKTSASELVVDPETVGQYTGLTDKNGKKIFEGDIVRYTRKNMYAPETSFHKQDLVSLHLVLWDSSIAAFVQRHYSLNRKRIIGKGSAVLYDDRAKENIIEVIGNIHDNPELLKGE